MRMRTVHDFRRILEDGDRRYRWEDPTSIDKQTGLSWRVVSPRALDHAIAGLIFLLSLRPETAEAVRQFSLYSREIQLTRSLVIDTGVTLRQQIHRMNRARSIQTLERWGGAATRALEFHIAARQAVYKALEKERPSLPKGVEPHRFW